MKKLKALIEQRAKLLAEFDALQEKDEVSTEERARLSAILEEVPGIDSEIKMLRRADELRAAAPTLPKEPETQGAFSIEVVEDRAAKAPFENFGTFLQAVRAHAHGVTDKRLLTRAASGSNEAVGSEGGFLVDHEISNEIIANAHAQAQLASKCRKIPIGPNANGIKLKGIDESSRASGSRWGGVQVYWANEADTVTAKKPKFRAINLELNKLMGIYYATDELMEDATALGSVATQAFSEEIAYMVDDAIVRGQGGGQPLGVLSSGALVSQAKETGQAAATVVWENILKMVNRLTVNSYANAEWYINPDVNLQLAKMSMQIGTGGVPVYLPPGGASANMYGTLYGRPVVPIEQGSALGTVGDIMLMDLSQYLIIEKGGVKTDQSMHVRFLYGEETFRFTYRADGQPLINSPVTAANGSTTRSPFVALATRS